LPVSSGNGPEISVLQPSEGATISQLPYTVSLSVSSQNSIARIDLSIDGQFIQSINSAPYTFNVNQMLSDGPHTIAVKAVDSNGAVSDTSVSVNYSLTTPLNLVEPQPNSVLYFPLNLTAESSNSYSIVNFYYQTEKGATKLIGQANNITKLGDKFQYTLNWVIGNLPKGTYKIFAQGDNGITTPKIKVTIP
jgi:hypothetical protein